MPPKSKSSKKQQLEISGDNKDSKISLTPTSDTVSAPAAVSVSDTTQDTVSTQDVVVAPTKSIKNKNISHADIVTLLEQQIEIGENESKRLKDNIKQLKDIRKLISKADQHQQKKSKNKTKVERKPTGFARPRGLSDEMLHFLTDTAKITEIEVNRKDEDISSVKIENGCKLARNELTKALCQHFKNTGMIKDDKDKRKIFLDQSTQKLFRINTEDFKKSGGVLSDDNEPIITYFNLQTYLPIHCLKDQIETQSA